MRKLPLVLLLAWPTVAAAQPVPDASQPPPPQQPQPPPPPPPGYAPPPQGYAPPPQQPQQPVMLVQMPAGLATHTGVVFEANIGIGFARASSDGSTNNSNAALAGADVGVGGWLSPVLALTGRISGVDITNSNSSSNGTVVAAFAGPSLQYWIDPHLWVAAGAGLATFRQVTNCTSTGATDQCGYNGFGLDLRVGYTFPTSSQSSFNVSGELTPGFYSIPLDDGTGSTSNVSATITGFALLVGYQYL